MLNSRKEALVVVPLLLLGAGLAAWFLGPWSRPKPAPEVPLGYITLWSGDVAVIGTELNPPGPGQACTVVGVNNSGKTVESVLFRFSTQAELTFASHTSGFGSGDGEFRATKPLMPGGRIEYLTLAAPGTLESVAVGWGERAKTHAVAAPLAAGKRLVISYEPDGKVSTRIE